MHLYFILLKSYHNHLYKKNKKILIMMNMKNELEKHNYTEYKNKNRKT